MGVTTLILVALRISLAFATTTCHFEINNTVRPCERFTPFDCTNTTMNSFPFGPWISSENDDKSINATFQIWYTQGIVKVPGHTSCFNFTAYTADTLPIGPNKLMLGFLPQYDLTSSSATVQGDDSVRCAYFSNVTSYVFQPTGSPTEPELRFLLIPDSRVQAVEAVLLGGDCNITCANSRNECKVTRNRTIIENFHKPVYFTHLTVGYYYCIRVSHYVNDRDECVLHTATKQLQEKFTSLTEISQPTTVTLDGINYVIISMVVIAIITLAAVIVKKFYHRGLSPVPTGDPEAPVDWVSIQQNWQETDSVLLLYSRDSPTFCEVIEAFRNLLENFAKIKVLDPFEKMQMERVSQNISGWLTQKITNPRIKLVIVVSDGAVIRQRILLQSRKVEMTDPHYLDAIFTQALSQLHDSPDLGNNYSRVFKVRFDEFTPSNMDLSHIVRFRLYHLLQHLGTLIINLKGLSPPYPNSEDIRNICPEETKQLETAIENMVKFCAECPNYISNQYSVVK